jgi:hypothetical protein
MIHITEATADGIRARAFRAGEGSELGVARGHSKQANQQTEQNFPPHRGTKMFIYQLYHVRNKRGRHSQIGFKQISFSRVREQYHTQSKPPPYQF